MNIKTFTAAKMSDALVLVKRRLGPQAVILHTRSYKQGGLLGLGARTVVEVTAADGREVGRLRRDAASRASPGRRDLVANKPTPSQARSTTVDRVPAGSAAPVAGDLIRRTYAAAKAELANRSDDVLVHETRNAAPAPSPVNETTGTDQLAKEMSAVRNMVARMMYQQKVPVSDQPAPPDVPDPLFEKYLSLLNQEVAEEVAQQVIEQVHASLAGGEVDDEAAVRQALIAAVTKLIPGDEHDGVWRPSADGRPRTIALIGPTGVGKTTTIAKLAADFKLKQKRRISLVTLDTYRIAAVDQLQTYANIIGVPLHVVTRPDQMIQALGRCDGDDAVLIDSAGRSQRDDSKLDQLNSFITAARPHEVHLVLSSTCTQKVLLDTVERFSRIPTDNIIFTKLDEAVTYGVVLNVVRKVNKRLSFMTTGQEVPHEIEPGRPDRLAALVLGHATIDQGAAKGIEA